MKRGILLLALALTLTGCTWGSTGLNACQDDSCFYALAAAAAKKGDTAQAQRFCAAIADQVKKAQCTGDTQPH